MLKFDLEKLVGKQSIIISLGSIFLCGSLLHVFQLPLGRILVTFSGSFLSMVFILRGVVMRSIQQKSKIEQFFHKNTNMGLALIITGMQFKILLWPNSTIMLNIGLASLSIGAIYYLFFDKSCADQLVKATVFSKSVVVIVLACGIFMAVLPTKNLIEFYFRNNPELMKIKLNLLEDPFNKSFQKAEDEYMKNYYKK